jgi:hypothetical protein
MTTATATAAPDASPPPPPLPGVLRVRRIGACVVMAAFVVALWLPIVQRPFKVGRFFHDDQGQWTGFADLDQRFQEGFAFRDVLLRERVRMRLALFDLLPDSVIRGRDGWLFYRSEIVHDGHTIDDFRGKVLADDATVREWAVVARQRAAAAAACGPGGNGVLAMIEVPNKEMVYPELMPPEVGRQRGEHTRSDAVVPMVARALAEEPGGRAVFIDLRPVFAAARHGADGAEVPPLYYRTDSHWTERGVRVAEEAITRALQPLVPGFAPLPEARLTPRRGPYAGDIGRLVLGKKMEEDAEFLDVDHAWPARTEGGLAVLGPGVTRAMLVLAYHRTDEGTEPLVTTVDDPALPTAVIFHDSFGPCMMPWVAQHFRRAVWCWNRSWDQALIARERPSVVIVERVERYVDRLFTDARTTTGGAGPHGP